MCGVWTPDRVGYRISPGGEFNDIRDSDPKGTFGHLARGLGALGLIGGGLMLRSTRGGADAAEAVLFESTSLSASCRLGKAEDIERSEGRDLGLRVFVGERQAVVSSTDFLSETLSALTERAVAMAKVAPPDPYCGLAGQELLATSFPDLELDDGFTAGRADLPDDLELVLVNVWDHAP